METNATIQQLQSGIDNPLISSTVKQIFVKEIDKLKTPIAILLPDLQKRLQIAKKMAKKNPELKSRIKIIEKMIKKEIGRSKQEQEQEFEVVLASDDSIVISDGKTIKKWDFNGTPTNSPTKEFFKTLKETLTFKTIKAKNFNEAYKKTKPTKQNPQTDFKVGDIYYSSWGYDQTNIDFYQIVKISGKKIALLQELKQDIIEPGDMQGKVMPIKDEFYNNQQLKRRLNRTGSFKINSSSYARKWDGKPKTFTSYHKKGGEIKTNWIQDAQKEMEKKGTLSSFTKQAKREGLSTVEFAKKVLKNPENYIKRTVERARFMKNINKKL